jgi:signal transduction histidine kinase
VLGISYIFGISITFISGLYANHRAFAPINQMNETLKNISQHNLSLRINVTNTKDELKELTKTINDMMDRIETAYNGQQQFVSDASHELRTPISVIQGYANMLNRWGKDDPKILQESIDAIINESDKMKDLVEKLLFLSRHDKKTLKLEKKRFNMRPVVEDMVKETKLTAVNRIIENRSWKM